MSILLAGLGLGFVFGFLCHAMFVTVAADGGDVALTRGGHRGPRGSSPSGPTSAGPVSVVPPLPPVVLNVQSGHYILDANSIAL